MYDALRIVGGRINKRHLLFITGSLMTSLPRFLSLEPAIGAMLLGNTIAIYQYLKEEDS